MAPFIGTMNIIPRFTFSFDFYDYYFIFIFIQLYHLIYFKKLNIIPPFFLKGFLVIILGTILSSYYVDSLNFNFLKQFLGILFSASSYYIVLKIADFNIKLLFDKYVNYAFYASLLAIGQEILLLSGVKIFTIYPGSLGLYRVSGFSGEPYNLALVLFPALLFSLIRFIKDFENLQDFSSNKNIKTLVILLAFFLTFSTTGYIGFFLGILVIALHSGYLTVKSSKFIFFLPFIIVSYYFLNFITEADKNFKRKLDEGQWFLQADESVSLRDYGTLNTSSFVLLSNFEIATEGFQEHPLFGIGLGNYEKLYNKKFDKLFGQNFEERFGKSNINDANSMFLRLIAETGIWGTAIFLLFILSHFIFQFNAKDKNDFYLLTINHAILILFIIRLIRCGNYLSDGHLFFFFLFYYSYRFRKYFYTAPS